MPSEPPAPSQDKAPVPAQDKPPAPAQDEPAHPAQAEAPIPAPDEAPGPAPQDEPAANGATAHRTGLLIDWGGVLTTNLFASFHAHCLRAEIDPQALRGRFREDPAFRELLIALEKGELDEPTFEGRLAALLELPSDGLIDGLFAGVKPDLAMLDAVRRAHAAGVRTALVSNSWGIQRYPHELFEELFDGIVISGELGIRKPSRRMYELGAERAGIPAERCVYIDDLPFNLTPAATLGMATVYHTSAETTIPELERLLGIPLRD